MTKLRKVLNNLEETIAGVLLVLMSVTTFTGVLARYLFGRPIPWSEEFARYALIWLAFVGAAACTKRNTHINMAGLLEYLPVRPRHLCSCLLRLIEIGLMGVLIYFGCVLAASATQPTSTLGVPQYTIYAIVPLCATSILARTIASAWREFYSAVAMGKNV